MIVLDDGYKILLDCGMFQGREHYVDEYNPTFVFDPKEVNVLILSHAHIDHSGRIPKLVKEGFRGRINLHFCYERSVQDHAGRFSAHPGGGCICT
jgi:metallo-beta-lactamase family protein